jgi:CubicO group peptidase (beta-lactamase class C family)
MIIMARACPALLPLLAQALIEVDHGKDEGVGPPHGAWRAADLAGLLVHDPDEPEMVDLERQRVRHDRIGAIDEPEVQVWRSGVAAVAQPAELLAGPLLDFTIYNPSFAWAAGALISTFADLARFFRALLGGRLLPRRLLAEMETPNPTSPAPLREAMGLQVLELSSGPWWATLAMFSPLAMPSSAPRTAAGSLAS